MSEPAGSGFVDGPEGFVPFGTYVNLGSEDAVYLVEPLLPEGGSMLLMAKEKVGKSALAIQLVHALTGGADDWLGFPVRACGRVLYLQVDTPRSTWRRRFKILTAAGWRFDDDRVRIADMRSLDVGFLNLDEADHRNYLKKLVQQVKEDPLPRGAGYLQEPIAVVIDTMRRIHLGDENSSGDQQRLLNNILDIVSPAAAIIVHHQGKTKTKDGYSPDIRDAIRGSSAVGGAMDVVLWLKDKKSGGSLEWLCRDLEPGKMPLSRKVIFAPRDTEQRNGVLTWERAEEQDGGPVEDEVIERLLIDRNLTRTAAAKVLSEKTELSVSGAQKRLRTYVDNHRERIERDRPDWLPKEKK